MKEPKNGNIIHPINPHVILISSSEPSGVIKFRINPDFRIEHSGMMHMMPCLLLLKFGFHII